MEYRLFTILFLLFAAIGGTAGQEDTSTDDPYFRSDQWNFEIRAGRDWQIVDLAPLRRMFGTAADGAIVAFEHKSTGINLTVTVVDLRRYPHVTTPEDYYVIHRQRNPREINAMIEPPQRFILNGYPGMKRLYTSMGGLTTVYGYTFIKDGKAYLVGGVGYSNNFIQNRPAMEKVMNTFRFLDQPKNLLDNFEPSLGAFLWHIPLSSQFGVYGEWPQLIVSGICLFISYILLNLSASVAVATRQGPGCLFMIGQSGMWFYGFCCLRALF